MDHNAYSQSAPGVRRTVVALIVSALLMISDWQHPEWFSPLRNGLRQAFDPIYLLARYPVLTGEWLGKQTMSNDQLRYQNAALKAELLQARVRLQKLAELSAENTRLRGLLNAPQLLDGRLLIAEVIGSDADPRRHILVIDRGHAEGLYAGQMVLDDRGLSGQVLQVLAHSARVLLLSDKEHSVSVRNARTGARSIVSGTGDSGRLAVQYVPNTADVKVGDQLVTSGLGQRFAAGYPVAVVSQVHTETAGEFAQVSAKPLSKLEENRHVIVLFNAPTPLAPTASSTTSPLWSPAPATGAQGQAPAHENAHGDAHGAL